MPKNQKHKTLSSHSEDMFRLIVESVRDYAIFMIDTESRICSWNPGVEHLLGYTEAEYVGQPFSIIFTPEDLAKGAHIQEVKTAEAEGRAEDQRWHQRKDGSRFWANGLVMPLRTKDGELRGFAKVMRDNTESNLVQEERARLLAQVEAERARLAAVVQQMPAGVVIAEAPSGKLLLGNKQVEHIWRRPYKAYGSIEEYHEWKGFHADGRPLEATEWPMARSITTGEVVTNEEISVLRGDGTRGKILFNSSPIRDRNERIIAGVVTFTDITEQKQAEEALRESEERFRLLVEGVKDHALFMVDVNGHITSWNPGVERLLGYSEAEFMNHHFSLIFTSDDIKDGRPGEVLSFAEQHGTAPYARWYVRKDGSVFWGTGTTTPTHDGMGRFRGFAKMMRDDTLRKQAEDKITHVAFHDALTDLPNRFLFIEHLKRTLANVKRHPEHRFAVLFLDLDRFKIINDSLGHVIADELLVATARKLLGCVRTEDIVARLGGDEFTVLLDNIRDVSDATHVADRIHKALAIPFHIGGHEVFTATSIGITLSSHGYDQPEEVLRDADTAMYRAKSQGRGRYEIFDHSMHERAMHLMRLENDLRRAVERGEFYLHYQPLMTLKNNRIAGFEALVRWQHPERGLISPAEFIPIAEETGLILPLGQWVLGEACQQMRQWQQQFSTNGSLSISVNLSSKQFAQPDLIEQVNGVLQQTGLAAYSLKLEITESAVMEKAESAIKMLNQLRDLGVKLHIDDFGTGYSSLSYLHRFPVDLLKIDRSFVSGMSVDRENSEIVRTVVQLAHNLGIEVMAEGVETAEQLHALRKLNCEYAQGYFFSKPVDSAHATKLLAA